MLKIKLGLLIPSSSILPMGKEFENGLKESLVAFTKSQQVEFYPEFIGQGGTKKVEEALDKFFNYHQVDLVTGIVSNKVAMDVADKFEKKRIPFIINNIGEHFPDSRKFNSYVFLNSIHIWQQVWSLSNWAVNKFGKKGMFVSGMYDAGYNFMKMMSDGMQAASADSEIPYSVAPMSNSQGFSQVEKVFEHIEMFKPDFVFSFFCGSEATDFLNGYVKKGYHKTIPLLSLPFLLESFDINGEQITIYTPFSSKNELKEGASSETSSSIFYQLGQVTGNIIAEGLKKNGLSNLVEALREDTTINVSNAGQDNKIYLVENIHNGDKSNIKKHIEKELPTINNTSTQFLTAIDELSSSWENPYLGV
jgi:ABC-type branched-subunit amino acid transport system substrate-binding protein